MGRDADAIDMALHLRLDDPAVALLLAAGVTVTPALVLSIGGPVGALVAGGAVLAGAGLLARGLRLASPVVVAVPLVGLVALAGTSSGGSGSSLVVAVLPVIAAGAGLEYAARRLAGRAAVRLSRPTEVALAVGTVAGVVWAGVVHAVLPASDDFSVLVRDVVSSGSAVGSLVDPLVGLVFVVSGPVLVVGLAVALLARFRLVTPLLFGALEVGSFLTGPNSGDSVGSLASLLWFVGVPLLLGVAAVELWVRTAIREYRRGRPHGS
jgi:hypothetical protein